MSLSTAHLFVLPPARHAQLLAAVGALFDALDADIAARRPLCRASGRCCHFETYGHRLYVTHVELIYFAASLPSSPSSGAPLSSSPAPSAVALPQFFQHPRPEGCPYQIDGLCVARQARPMGCRIYFCDETAQDWQQTLYERYHARLRTLHESFAVPYGYLEWRAALRRLIPPDAGTSMKSAEAP